MKLELVQGLNDIKSPSSFFSYRCGAALCFILLSLLLSVASSLFATASSEVGFCTREMATLGGLRDSHSQSPQNSAEIDSLARFAVEEHNKKENALLELARVVKAQEQVVAGTLHHLTLEVIEAGRKGLYEAKIWVKPWMNFKELQEFRHVGDVPSFTPSDLGVKKDGQESGWRPVHVDDPVVQDAANHAVKTIQQRSNSLFPYELQEIVYAKAEVIEGYASAKFDMLIKVNRGEKQEKFKVEVHKKNDGAFDLNQVQPEHSS